MEKWSPVTLYIWSTYGIMPSLIYHHSFHINLINYLPSRLIFIINILIIRK